CEAASLLVNSYGAFGVGLLALGSRESDFVVGLRVLRSGSIGEIWFFGEGDYWWEKERSESEGVHGVLMLGNSFRK
ncbi:hypothetical protein Dimus_028712, partial [Dionaea muscipula]